MYNKILYIAIAISCVSATAFCQNCCNNHASHDKGSYENRFGRKLVWSEEFDKGNKPDSAVWSFEEGFSRNHEDQWYQPDNAFIKDGSLFIEARNIKSEKRKNPRYNPSKTGDWRNREYIGYTSSCMITRGKFDFQYGTVEVRAKIPTASGAWPAIWLLGDNAPWPENGEIDMMEYYRIDGVPHILANACWGSDRAYTAIWDDAKIPFTHFTDKDPEWASKFHVWRMDWDENAVRLYLDDELLNEIPVADTVNGKIGKGTNAMKNRKYLLVNLAIGGDHGGVIDDSAFPMPYEIDYIRVYQ